MNIAGASRWYLLNQQYGWNGNIYIISYSGSMETAGMLGSDQREDFLNVVVILTGSGLQCLEFRVSRHQARRGSYSSGGSRLGMVGVLIASGHGLDR